MSVPIFCVDAFTERPFAGNPAAVCILPEERADAWLQSVAAEMNLSETAFLRKEGDGWRLRWFTPTVEVDLCGHATLASAHTLWERGSRAPGRRSSFARRAASSRRRAAAMRSSSTFRPSRPPRPRRRPGCSRPSASRRSRSGAIASTSWSSSTPRTRLRRIQPRFPALAEACGKARGVIVTAPSRAPEFDFVSRYFAPSFGIDEDPVTGSAHCCLGPFWAARLGKPALVGFQASRRGGVVGVRVADSRVFLGGRAVTVLRGELV